MREAVQPLIDFLRMLTNPEALGAWSAPVIYVVFTAIVFAETGLLVGFFLPGDSLLFTAGVLAGTGHVSLLWLNALLIVAAIVGDTVGYWIGAKSGPRLFTKEQSLLFRKDYLLQAKAFYERHGPKTIVIARFVPIIRTFAPVVAGIGEMEYRKFLTYNIFGGIGWVTSLTIAGYFLGSIPWVRTNLEKVILLIIFLSILPGIIEVVRARRAAAKAAPEAPPAPTPPPTPPAA